MPHIKVLKDPGFLYDLNYLFYLKFNTQLCIENLVDDTKKKHTQSMRKKYYSTLAIYRTIFTFSITPSATAVAL